MTVASIHQPQYLPYLGFFHKLIHSDIFVVLDNISFQKNGLQNRNRIKTKQGESWLTVPVLHKFGQAINEVRIAPDVFWNRKHWNALVSNYSRSPYFSVYGPGLKELLDRKWIHLWEVNVALIKWVLDVCSIQKPFYYASQLKARGEQSELLIDICNLLKVDRYLSGPGGKLYMDLPAFESANVEVIWQEFTSPTYTQMFPEVDFIPNLSVLDALFCCGPAIFQILKEQRGGLIAVSD